ncbi:MAG: hypothetical protein ACOYYF_04200 [Chloroflexota bacterium]|nr:hypothetical protein [Chloroflexota bacterium]MBI5701951.1 hypothetical protein [Chloroflexota bacterium]
MGSTNDQAVIVFLEGKNLSEEVYKEYDVSTLEDQLIEIIESQSLGEYDGNEFGTEGVVLYMYTSDAENLFSTIEPILQAYPLCKNARVIIRQGGPGSQQRMVLLSTD